MLALFISPCHLLDINTKHGESKMQIENFELPAFWASALVNGDTSGLTDTDEQALNAFTEFMIAEYGSCWALDCSEEPSFMRWHDAARFGVLACDVLTFSFDITKH